jgi:hypothetical protein
MAFFNDFFEQSAKGHHDFSDQNSASGYYMMLLSAAPAATHTVKANIVGTEISGDGYDAGGKHLSDITVSETSGVVTVDCGDVSWGASASFTARAMAVYHKGTHNSLVDPLVCYEDFGSDKTVANATFTYQVNASGLLTFQSA